MRDELEKMVSAGKLGQKHLEPLLQLTGSGYCYHRSWGFGKITTVDTVFARFTIDFTDKPGHQMDLGFAADSLKPIPTTHILARKAADLEGLRRIAALNHLELIKVVLGSFGGQATVDQIQQVLVPDVIADDWRKWWEAARAEMKKDGHFRLPTKKSEPIIYQEEQMSLQDRTLSDFKEAKGLKARILIASEALKSFADLSDQTGTVNTIVAKLNEEIATHQRTQMPTALEAVFIRDELKAAAGLAPAPDDITAAQLWSQDNTLAEVLDGIPAAKHKQVLESLKAAKPDAWADIVLRTINAVPAKQAGECATLLINEGREADLQAALLRYVSHHTASSELLLWLAKAKGDHYASLMGTELFRAMLTSMERDQFNEKKSNRLGDFILKETGLLKRLIEDTDIEVVKDLTRALQFSPVFDDMDKRSLLARIVKVHPDVQSLISGESTRQQEAPLVVSWTSLEKKKADFDDLVNRRIPANSKDIELARSYGDLRENHEFKAAKEEQKRLTGLKATMAGELERARGTDFATVRTDVVSIGTKVDLTELNSGQNEVYTIMGAWDSEPDKNILSYLTPLAQSVLNKPVGTEVEFEMDGHKKRYRINSIAPALAHSTILASNPADTASPDVAQG
jgi:transcription elongation GreA/GreB family factor